MVSPLTQIFSGSFKPSPRSSSHPTISSHRATKPGSVCDAGSRPSFAFVTALLRSSGAINSHRLHKGARFPASAREHPSFGPRMGKALPNRRLSMRGQKVAACSRTGAIGAGRGSNCRGRVRATRVDMQRCATVPTTNIAAGWDTQGSPCTKPPELGVPSHFGSDRGKIRPRKRTGEEASSRLFLISVTFFSFIEIKMHMFKKKNRKEK